jgi:hypothetical protein
MTLHIVQSVFQLLLGTKGCEVEQLRNFLNNVDYNYLNTIKTIQFISLFDK